MKPLRSDYLGGGVGPTAPITHSQGSTSRALTQHASCIPMVTHGYNMTTSSSTAIPITQHVCSRFELTKVSPCTTHRQVAMRMRRVRHITCMLNHTIKPGRRPPQRNGERGVWCQAPRGQEPGIEMYLARRCRPQRVIEENGSLEGNRWVCHHYMSKEKSRQRARSTH